MLCPVQNLGDDLENSTALAARASRPDLAFDVDFVAPGFSPASCTVG